MRKNKYVYMKSLRLKNFRCLEDTGDVEIRPLTFLVGANSSGKVNCQF